MLFLSLLFLALECVQGEYQVKCGDRFHEDLILFAPQSIPIERTAFPHKQTPMHGSNQSFNIVHTNISYDGLLYQSAISYWKVSEQSDRPLFAGQFPKSVFGNQTKDLAITFAFECDRSNRTVPSAIRDIFTLSGVRARYLGGPKRVPNNCMNTKYPPVCPCKDGTFSCMCNRENTHPDDIDTTCLPSSNKTRHPGDRRLWPDNEACQPNGTANGTVKGREYFSKMLNNHRYRLIKVHLLSVKYDCRNHKIIVTTPARKTYEFTTHPKQFNLRPVKFNPESVGYQKYKFLKTEPVFTVWYSTKRRNGSKVFNDVVNVGMVVVGKVWNDTKKNHPAQGKARIVYSVGLLQEVDANNEELWDDDAWVGVVRPVSLWNGRMTFEYGMNMQPSDKFRCLAVAKSGYGKFYKSPFNTKFATACQLMSTRRVLKFSDWIEPSPGNHIDNTGPTQSGLPLPFTGHISNAANTNRLHNY